MVAVLALCLDWVHHCGMLHMHDGSNRRNISYLLSCCLSSLVRHLGLLVACLQPSGNGLYMVWSTVVDRWSVQLFILITHTKK